MNKEEARNVIAIHYNHWQRLRTEKICTEEEGKKTVEAFGIAINALEAQKSGEWINDGISGLFTCPFCHAVHTYHYNYCPNCGAKMEVGE